MGYIEPLEFASFGLLAVAFVSLSSPWKEMRKLGYEAIGRFKNALEVLFDHHYECVVLKFAFSGLVLKFDRRN